MLFDGISITEGSSIANATIASGTAFPAEASTGELYFRTDSPNAGLYVYNGTEWYLVGAGTISLETLSVKQSARVGTTGNITLEGTQTVDGVAVVAGNRVLVKDQSDAKQNGVYIVSSGGWSRAIDFNSSPTQEVKGGDFILVTEGTTQASTAWVISTNGTITVGTDDIIFAQFAGSGGISAGAGLVMVDKDLSVGTASSSRIVVNANDIDLATVGTAGTYRSVTTDAYGRVTAGTNPTTLAGYGITDAQALDADLTAIAGLSTTGLVTRTSSGNAATRAIAVSGTGLSVTDGDGVAGNPTITSNATSSNTVSTIVARDGSGNFTAGTITAALTGNASTASALQTARSITASGDASWTVSFDGSAAATADLTLATVNTEPQAGAFRKVTVNGKGLVTATSAVGASDITTALAYTPVNAAGDTMTGALILSGDPTVALGAATKQYVDNIASGLNVHNAVRAATTSALTATYANGSSGVGATLTGTGDLPTIDGVALVVGERVLVKDQASGLQNGIYVVTTATGNWVLTRASDFDNSPTNEVVAGDAVFVQEGTSLASTQWVQATTGTITVGTTAITFTQFGGPGSLSAGTGISITGTTVANTGVTSITGTADQVTASASTGSVTLSLPSSVTIAGTMQAGTFSGSGASLTSIPNSATTATAANTASAIVARDSSGNFSAGTITAALTGNASTATALATGRTFSVSGDATGTSGSFDGSGNATIPVTLASTAVTAGSYGSATQVGTFTVDAKGRLTAAGNTTVTPAFSSITGKPTTLAGYGITDAVGGSNTQIQYNSNGALAGSSAFTFNVATGSLTFNPGAISNPQDVTLVAASASAGGAGSINLLGGDGTGAGVGGQANLQGGAGGSSNGQGGQAAVFGGFGGGTNGNGGDAVVSGGTSQGTGRGGHLMLYGGVRNGASGTFGTIRLHTASIERVRIDAAGNVGVGTTTPATALDVNGTVTATSVTTSSVSLGTIGSVRAATLTTSATTANQVVDSVSTSSVRTVRYTIQVTSGSAYQATELMVIHDGTTAYITEYGTVLTGSALATFDADINTGNLRLLVTPVNAATTIKVVGTAVTV